MIPIRFGTKAAGDRLWLVVLMVAISREFWGMQLILKLVVSDQGGVEVSRWVCSCIFECSIAAFMALRDS